MMMPFNGWLPVGILRQCEMILLLKFYFLPITICFGVGKTG